MTSGFGTAASDDDIPPLYVTEFQSVGNSDEWVELTNTVDYPINLYDYAVSPQGGGSRKPSEYFGGYRHLGQFGIPAVLENQTYYLNAEDLYIDTYYTAGDGPYDNFYLYKVEDNNSQGKYYQIGSSYRIWWDAVVQGFLNESEKDTLPPHELEDHVYQIYLPDGWFHRYQYIQLNPDDEHKHETDQQLFDYDPGPINGTEPLKIDFDNMDGNNESQALADHWKKEYNVTMKSTTLLEVYSRSDLYNGIYLNLTDDNDGTFLTQIDLIDSSHFWTVSSLPHNGVIFVNDNHPDTMFYCSHYSGEQVPSPGPDITEIDITNSEHFDHFTGEEYYKNSSALYGTTWIDFTDPNITAQITTRQIEAPILTDTIYVNKNTGAIRSGPGSNTVEISLDLTEDNNSWLFPIGATYKDWSISSTPTRSLPHLIVITDEECDPDENHNDLFADGILYIWNVTGNYVPGDPIGWGTRGPAPEPVGGWSAQAYFDGSRYHWGDNWTLGPESQGVDNSVPAPAYGSADVVINEINPTFVELYNRGGTQAGLNSWKLTGEGWRITLSGMVDAGGFLIIPESAWPIPFYPYGGLRISLFDDLGVLVSSIGVQTNVLSSVYSYCARHIDGMGPDFTYNDTMLQPYANGEPGAHPNCDWDIGPERTAGSRNYEEVTVLQIGQVDGHYGMIENLSVYYPGLAGGIMGTPDVNDFYLDSWDIVLYPSGLSSSNSHILDDYILNGGRLYVEYGDWTALMGTDLYDTLHLSAIKYEGPVSTLTGNSPLTTGMEMEYNGTVGSRFIPNADNFRVWDEGGNTYTVFSIDIDTSNHENSYRVVASALKYGKMREGSRGDPPVDYLREIVDFFMRSDDDVNHRPEVELVDPIPDPQIKLYKARPRLLWQNQDTDIWDQVPGAMKYTLYIDTDEMKVASMDAFARSAVFVEDAATMETVDALDAPVAGIYYWGIFAEDKYEKTAYKAGGVFKYDSEIPYVESMVPMNGNTLDDPLPIGSTVVFGSGHQNSQGEIIGRPNKFAITMSDNFGLKFSNNHNVAEQLFKDEYHPPITVFSVKVLYHYGGQYEDDLPNFNLFVDAAGTNNDLESLTGQPGVGQSDVDTFYMIPDAPIPDGRYHFFLQAADEVRWGSFMDYTFEVDLTAPEKPTDITITPETYRDQSDMLFLKAGESYTLSVTAPSLDDDGGGMNRVVFQHAAADFPGSIWETIGTDYDVSDNSYSVPWTPDIHHILLRAIAYDQIENPALSNVFNDFHVDDTPPHTPFALQANLSVDPVVRAIISGSVSDGGIPNQASGPDYAVIFNEDEPMVNESGKMIKIPIHDGKFKYSVFLDECNGINGDITYKFRAKAYDHVGNEGELSTYALWNITNQPDRMRVITPKWIRDIPMREEFREPDDSRDELRELTVTFLSAGADYQIYPLIIRPGELSNSTDAVSLGLPENAKFLKGYCTLETSPEFTGFLALVSIEFHISSRSQLGAKMSQILENIRLISREKGGSRWTMLDLIGGQPQPVDVGKDLFRVQARVTNFSDFALIISQSDLTIPEISITQGELKPGQYTRINVTVNNGGPFPHDADNVKVKLFFVDESGDQEYIGELDYGTIDPEFRYYPDESSDTRGNPYASMMWYIPDHLGDDEIIKVTIRALVDPDGWVRETDETNNERTINLTMEFPPLPPFLVIMFPDNHSKVEGNVYIYGEVNDNIVPLPDIEYRIDGNDSWRPIEDYTSWTLANGNKHWHMNLDSTELEDGKHTIEFRAYDGKHYSSTQSVSLEVDNFESEDDRIIEIPRIFTLFILIAALVILSGTLLFVVRTPPGYFDNRRTQDRTGSNERAVSPEVSVGSSAPNSPTATPLFYNIQNPPPRSPDACPNCGTPIKLDPRERPIRYICPFCGNMTINPHLK